MAGLLCLASAIAHANGRLPGATGLAVHPTDERQLLLGLTFGLALTRDGGASWTWMCEQQIEGNGGDVDPSIVVTGDGSLVVISLSSGGVLVSRDDGCSFERAMGPLRGQRGVDLTLDPSQPGRVLALMSTIVDATDAGRPRFRSFVAQSLDHGRSWAVLAELPNDIWVETLEIAPSNPDRIYVSGTASDNLLQGIIERSDDGGLTWTQTTVELPRSSGSLFLSAVHPKDPDRLWFRVPRRDDIYGVLPAKLWLTTDAGASFEQVGETDGGMLGFALSPDAERIAFGGPLDGLFLAPADGSAAPTKVDDMQVSCLRWLASGLYACVLEPDSPYSLGFATEPMQGFVPLWHRSDTCREACAPPSPLEMKCREPWETIAPLVGAEAAVCDASSFVPDAGTVVDAAPETPEPTAAAPAPPTSGCTVTFPAGASTPWWFVMMLAGWMRRTRRRFALRVDVYTSTQERSSGIRKRNRDRCVRQLGPRIDIPRRSERGVHSPAVAADQHARTFGQACALAGVCARSSAVLDPALGRIRSRRDRVPDAAARAPGSHASMAGPRAADTKQALGPIRTASAAPRARRRGARALGRFRVLAPSGPARDVCLLSRERAAASVRRPLCRLSVLCAIHASPCVDGGSPAASAFPRRVRGVRGPGATLVIGRSRLSY